MRRHFHPSCSPPASQNLLWRLKKYAAARQQLMLNKKSRSFQRWDVISCNGQKGGHLHRGGSRLLSYRSVTASNLCFSGKYFQLISCKLILNWGRANKQRHDGGSLPQRSLSYLLFTRCQLAWASRVCYSWAPHTLKLKAPKISSAAFDWFNNSEPHLILVQTATRGFQKKTNL